MAPGGLGMAMSLGFAPFANGPAKAPPARVRGDEARDRWHDSGSVRRSDIFALREDRDEPPRHDANGAVVRGKLDQAVAYAW